MFGSEKRWQLTGYIGPYISFSSVEGHFAADAGGTAGFVVNKKLFVGFYGQKLLTKVPRTDLAEIGFPDYTNGEIGMVHAGGTLGYIHKKEQVLHWGISSSAGVGQLSIMANDPMNNYSGKIREELVVIVIPKAFLEMKMTPWFKINFSGGYRFLAKVNSFYVNLAGESIPIFNKSDYTKSEFSISLLIGKFGFRSYLLK